MAERKLLSNDIERVEDGDTIRVNGKTYRIGGIDAAEVPHDDMDRGAAPGGLVARDIVAHTPQAVRLSNKDGGYGRSLAYFEPTEEGGRTSNEILIAADLAGPSTFEDPPEDVKRAAMQKTYRILHGIDDDEYVKNIRGFVRNVNSATSDYGIAGYNPYESKGYREPNKDKWMQNSLARGADMLQKNLYEAASAVSNLVGADGVKEWADRNAKINDIDITRNPARVKSLSDIHGFGDALIYGTESVLEQAPSLAFDLTTAAASGGLGVVLKGVGLVANATKWAKAGAFASSFIQNTGDAYDSMKQAGAQHASGGAILTGLAMGALDFAGLDYMVKGVMKPFGISDDVAEETVKQAVGAKALVNDIFKTGTKTAVFEGSTESLQELVKEGGVTLAGGDTDKLGPLDERLLESFVAGGVVGGAYAGAGRSAKHGIDALANRKNREENAELANTYHEHDLNAQQIDADGNVTQAPNRYYDPRHEAVEPEQGFAPQETVTEPKTVQEPVQTTPDQTAPISEENNSQNIDLQQENQEIKPNQTEPQPQPITIDGAAFRDAVNDMRQQPIEDVVEEPAQEEKQTERSGYNPRVVLEAALFDKSNYKIPETVREIVRDELNLSNTQKSAFSFADSRNEIEAPINYILKNRPDIEKQIDERINKVKNEIIEEIDRRSEKAATEGIEPDITDLTKKLQDIQTFNQQKRVSFNRKSFDFDTRRREAINTIKNRIDANYNIKSSDEVGKKTSAQAQLAIDAHKQLNTAIKDRDATRIAKLIENHAPVMKKDAILLASFIADSSGDLETFAQNFDKGAYTPEQIADRLETIYLNREYTRQYTKHNEVNNKHKEAVQRSFELTKDTALEVPEHQRPTVDTESEKDKEVNERVKRAVADAVYRFHQGIKGAKEESSLNKVEEEQFGYDYTDRDASHDNSTFSVSDLATPDENSAEFESSNVASTDARGDAVELVRDNVGNDKFDMDSVNDLDLLREAVANGYDDVPPSIRSTRYTNFIYNVYEHIKSYYPQYTPEIKHNKNGKADHRRFKASVKKSLEKIVDVLSAQSAVDNDAIQQILYNVSSSAYILGSLYNADNKVAGMPWYRSLEERLKPSPTDLELLAIRHKTTTKALQEALDNISTAVIGETVGKSRKATAQKLTTGEANSAEQLINVSDLVSHYKKVPLTPELIDQARSIAEASANLNPQEIITKFFEAGILNNKYSISPEAFVNLHGVTRNLDDYSVVTFHVGKSRKTLSLNLCNLTQAAFNNTDVADTFSNRFVNAVHDMISRLVAYKTTDGHLSNVQEHFDRLPDNTPLVVFDGRVYLKRDYIETREQLIADSAKGVGADVSRLLDTTYESLKTMLYKFASFTDNELRAHIDKQLRSSYDSELERLRTQAREVLNKPDELTQITPMEALDKGDTGFKARNEQEAEEIASFIREPLSSGSNIRKSEGKPQLSYDPERGTVATEYNDGPWLPKPEEVLSDEKRQAYAPLYERINKLEAKRNKAISDKILERRGNPTISKADFELAVREASANPDFTHDASLLSQLVESIRAINIDPTTNNDEISAQRIERAALMKSLNALIGTLRSLEIDKLKPLYLTDKSKARNIREHLEAVRHYANEIQTISVAEYLDEIGEEGLSRRSEEARMLSFDEPDEADPPNQFEQFPSGDIRDIFKARQDALARHNGSDAAYQTLHTAQAMRETLNEAINTNSPVYVSSFNGDNVEVSVIKNGEVTETKNYDLASTADVKRFITETYDGVILHSDGSARQAGARNAIDINMLAQRSLGNKIHFSADTTRNIEQAYAFLLGSEAKGSLPETLYAVAHSISRLSTERTSVKDILSKNRADKSSDVTVSFSAATTSRVKDDITRNIRTLIRGAGINNPVRVVVSQSTKTADVRVETTGQGEEIAYVIHMPEVDNDPATWVMQLGHEVGHIVLDQYVNAFNLGGLDAKPEVIQGFEKLYNDVLRNPSNANKEAFADSFAQQFVERLGKYGESSIKESGTFRAYVIQRFKQLGAQLIEFLKETLNTFEKITGRKQALNSQEQKNFLKSLNTQNKDMYEYARQMQENLLGEKIKMYPKRRAGLLTSIAGAIVPNYIRLARISKPIAEMFTKQVHLKTVLQKRASSREIAGRLYQGSKINEKLVENGYKDLVNGRNTVAANMVKTWIENINKMVKRTLDPNDIGAYDADRINDTKIPYQLDPNKVDRNPARVVAILKQQGIQHAELLVDTALRGVDDNTFGVVAQQSWSTILANDKHRAALADYLDNNGVSVINSYIHNLAHTAGMKVAFGAHEREESDGTLRKYDDGRIRFHARVKLNHFVQGLSPEEADVVGQIYRSLNGDWGPRAPNIVRNSFNALNLISSMGILTYAGLSNIMDTAIPLMKAGKFSIAMKGIYQALRQISASNRDISQLAHSLGVINHSILQNTLSGIFINDRNTLGRALDKTADLYFTLNGMNFTTKISRLVATSIAVESFKHAARNPSDRVNASLLKQLNMTASDVQRVMDFIGDGDINKIFDDNLIADGALANAIENFKNGLVYFVSNSTLDPNAISDPILASNPWFALLTNLKRFFYAFHDMVIRGQFNEIAARSAQMNGLKDLPYVAYPLFAMFMFLMPLSFAAWWLRELFRDGDLEKGNPADLPAWEIAKGTFSRSGVLGLGEIYMNAENAQEYGTPAVLSLTPSVAQTYRVASDIYNEKYEQAAKDGLPFYKVIQNWSKTLSE